MSLNSVNTNMGAMVALQSLNHTNTELAATQKRISTGFRVSDATDDGAAYAVAERVRSDVSALTSSNEQLGNVKSVVGTAITGLNNISSVLTKMAATFEKLADASVVGQDRQNYIDQYDQYRSNIKSIIQDSSYNGKTLIGNIGASSGYGNVTVVRNEAGDNYSIATVDGSALYANLSLSATARATASSTAVSAAAAIVTLMKGGFKTTQTSVGKDLNTYGNASRYVDLQVSFNKDKIDSLNSGLGYLVDADLSKEAAQLQALQTRQQLGTQALSIANQAPQSLLSLFRG